MADKSQHAKAITVYLLIPEVRDPLDAIAEPLPDLEGLQVIPGIEWILAIRNKEGKRPGWTEFFRKVIDLKRFGLNSSVSAVLVVPTEGKLWAVTFGRGRSLLKESIVEERFGLRVALNAIDRDKVRAIDKETFDSFASQARQQSTDDTEFDNFGVDVDRDLLYAVVGVPREPRLGRRLAGKDALLASTKVAIAELPGYLGMLAAIYKSEDYKKDFAWVDNIYEVRDKALKRELDTELVQKLASGDTGNAWLAIPEILDWQRVRDFRYLNPSSSFTVDDVHLKTYLDAFGSRKSSIDILSIKRSRIVCLDYDGEMAYRWNAYRCLYAEVTKDNDAFLLTNGHWYKINREIVLDIKNWYDNLAIETKLMPEMEIKESEDAYNKRIGQQVSYHLFHGKLVRLPANRGIIEFCDLACLGKDGCDLIHVKRYGPSSKLSHLFYQGSNSARLLRTSPEFREALSKSIEGDAKLSARFLTEPTRHEYRVVFAIGSSSVARLELPLFSKLSLRQAFRDLDGLGFRSSIAQISIPQEERKMKKIRSNRKTF